MVDGGGWLGVVGVKWWQGEVGRDEARLEYMGFLTARSYERRVPMDMSHLKRH